MHENATRSRIIRKCSGRSVAAATVISLLGLGAIVMLVVTVANLQHFRDVAYPESANLLRLQEFSFTGKIYPDFNRPPYLVTLYGPLCYVSLGAAYKLGQIAAVNPKIVVRSAILASFLICLWLAFRLARQLYPQRRIAYLSLLFAASIAPLSSWVTQIRGDLPALALSLMSLYLYLTASNPRRRVFAAISAGIALLIKQTFFAAPLAILIWCFWRREFRDGLFWIAVVVLTVAVGLTVTYLCEPLILQHLTALGNPMFELSGALRRISEAICQPQVIFGALGIYSGARERDSDKLLIVFYCLLSWIMAVMTIAQVGGDWNYFWEPLMVSAIMAGPGFRCFFEKLNRSSTAFKALASIVVICVFFNVLKLYRFQTRDGFLRIKTHAAAQAQWNLFLSRISGRRLLSIFPDITIQSSIPEIPDPLLNNVLAHSGKWDFAPVIREIRASKYDFVIVSANPDLAAGQSFYRGFALWPLDLWQAVKAHYVPFCFFQDMEVWLPRNVPNARDSLSGIGCKTASGNHSKDDLE